MIAVFRSLQAAPRLACTAAGTWFSASLTQATRGFKTDATSSSISEDTSVLYRMDGHLHDKEREDLVVQFLSEDNMSREELVKTELVRIREAFAIHEFDSGSTPVQVASLTFKIKALTDHLNKHKKDVPAKRGLMGLLSQRKRLLKYIRKKDPEVYQSIILRLGLKDRTFVGNKYDED